MLSADFGNTHTADSKKHTNRRRTLFPHGVRTRAVRALFPAWSALCTRIVSALYTLALYAHIVYDPGSSVQGLTHSSRRRKGVTGSDPRQSNPRTKGYLNTRARSHSLYSFGPKKTKRCWVSQTNSSYSVCWPVKRTQWAMSSSQCSQKNGTGGISLCRHQVGSKWMSR